MPFDERLEVRVIEIVVLDKEWSEDSSGLNLIGLELYWGHIDADGRRPFGEHPGGSPHFTAGFAVDAPE